MTAELLVHRNQDVGVAGVVPIVVGHASPRGRVRGGYVAGAAIDNHSRSGRFRSGGVRPNNDDVMVDFYQWSEFDI